MGLSAAFLAGTLLAASPATAAGSAAEAFPYGQGHFDALRELHVLTYEPDFRWRRSWEGSKHVYSGLEFVHGSVSQRELYTERRVVLNVPLVRDGVRDAVPVEEGDEEQAGIVPDERPRLWLRYEREEIGMANSSADVSRIELQWRIAGPLALTVSGNPTFDKSRSSGGAGIFVADERRRNYLDLEIQADQPFFNKRSRLAARHEVTPMRLLAEANLEWEEFRLYGAADLGRRSRTVFREPFGSDGIERRSAFDRRTEMKAEWMPMGSGDGPLLVGARHRSLIQHDRRAHFRGYVDPERRLDDFDFERNQQDLDLYTDWIRGDLRVRAQVGGRIQRDSANFPIEPDYVYTRQDLLFGARVHWLGFAEGLHLGIGYWGDVYRAQRDVEWRPFPHRTRIRAGERGAGYADKADFVIGYALTDRIRTEAVLTQQVTRGRFGGGSLKASILF